MQIVKIAAAVFSLVSTGSFHIDQPAATSTPLSDIATPKLGVGGPEGTKSASGLTFAPVAGCKIAEPIERDLEKYSCSLD